MASLRRSRFGKNSDCGSAGNVIRIVKKGCMSPARRPKSVIPVLLAFNPVTAPIATVAAIGGAAMYGMYKVAKFTVEKEDRA